MVRETGRIKGPGMAKQSLKTKTLNVTATGIAYENIVRKNKPSKIMTSTAQFGQLRIKIKIMDKR